MATAAIASSKLARGLHKWIWTLTDTNDTGAPLDPNGGSGVFSDKTYQVSGTFGAGGTIILEGSNDGVTYFALRNTHDNSQITGVTAAELEGILENPAYIRPRLTAGTGVSVVVTIIGRGIIQKN